MPIENRNLEPGTVLVARHKKQEHTCTVVATADGLRYRLEDGSEHKSPSSAGRVITGGVAVNGWRFWSLQGDLKPAAEGKAKPAAKAKPKAAKPAAKKAPAKKAKGAKAKGKAHAARSAERYGCGVCSETFATLKAATQHAQEAHLS